MQSLADFFTGTAVWNAPKNTGRIPDMTSKQESAYRPYKIAGDNIRRTDPNPNQLQEVMHYRQSPSDLNVQFFSVSNTNLIQDEIRYAVYAKSGAKKYTIDRQSDDDLFLVMRSYYLQYARNDPERVKEELDSLNGRVIAYCSDKIMVEIEAYRYYRADQENFPEPISAPTNVNVYGTRTGELKSFF